MKWFILPYLNVQLSYSYTFSPSKLENKKLFPFSRENQSGAQKNWEIAIPKRISPFIGE